MEQGNHNTKKRSWKQISEKERYKIEGYWEEGLSCSKIAILLGKSKRTIEREIKKGMVEQRRINPSNNKYAPMHIVEMKYKADVAQNKTDERASNKGKNLKMVNDPELAKFIENQIIENNWSPDSIIGRINQKNLLFSIKVCTKTVYNSIDRGFFQGVSNKNLWEKHKGQKRKYQKVRTVALNNINGKSISERPEEINNREEKGHWEIDFVVGKQGTKPAILTLVERKSRKSCYILTKNKTQSEVLRALRKLARRLKGDFSAVFKSITADNGNEFLDSEGMKKAVRCAEIYYAHPYSSWERGSNENSNRILRRFIPKGTDITTITAKKLQQIEDWVNNYPRKILGYRTANEVFASC